MPTLTSLIDTSSGLLTKILPLLVSFGVLYFVWGVIQYFIADTEEAKTKGRDTVVFGVIGLAVILSTWGLVNIVRSTFGLARGSFLEAPNVTVLVPGQSSGNCSVTNTFPGWMDYFTCVIGSSVIPLLFALSVLMFVWGTIKFFIIDVDEEAKREQGRQFMLWGIIALAVMVSVWGLVHVLTGTFKVSGTEFIPRVKP